MKILKDNLGAILGGFFFWIVSSNILFLFLVGGDLSRKQIVMIVWLFTIISILFFISSKVPL
ncbi:MAG: hypothetical protein HN390_04805 [Anaerolineae bacterium]|jgi:hypothetical protein|nr:hypothetical protein [Anaerolineae bacterium]MBT7190857.1 hypothetical protein [Anaerolineae bacterium]MBT7990796.1 hypothetical protein [Anaerolineae bacterium]